MHIACPTCGFDIEFAQPYAYHAGFADVMFLYDDAGTSTLVWGIYDPDYIAVVGKPRPWSKHSAQHALIEEALSPAPAGGRWRFTNPPRCPSCTSPIGAPPSEGNVYYFIYPNSLLYDGERGRPSLRSALKPRT